MRHTQAGAAVTALILETFRLNGQLLAEGDRLTAPLGLTSARWQVMGAIRTAGRPLTVAQIARRMGLSRQNVRRIANDLAGDGFLRFDDNPDHKRAKLAVPTQAGEATMDRIDAIQADWANALADGLDPAALDRAVGLMADIRARAERLQAAARAPTEEEEAEPCFGS